MSANASEVPEGDRLERPLTVLVVDDEPLVRRLLEVGLRQLGFGVELATDGLEAVARYGQAGCRVDLVLCDVRMPGLDGPQTLAALRKLDPAVRLCFMTAQSGLYSSEDLLHLGAVRVFYKPFESLVNLADELRAVAESRPDG
jgi:CheY-like chemotaxis protein